MEFVRSFVSCLHVCVRIDSVTKKHLVHCTTNAPALFSRSSRDLVQQIAALTLFLSLISHENTYSLNYQKTKKNTNLHVVRSHRETSPHLNCNQTRTLMQRILTHTLKSIRIASCSFSLCTSCCYCFFCCCCWLSCLAVAVLTQIFMLLLGIFSFHSTVAVTAHQLLSFWQAESVRVCTKNQNRIVSFDWHFALLWCDLVVCVLLRSVPFARNRILHTTRKKSIIVHQTEKSLFSAEVQINIYNAFDWWKQSLIFSRKTKKIVQCENREK